jgi:hypothetical protein
MKALCGVCISFVCGAGLCAQTRPGITGSFGNVVFPGGTAAQRGVTRSFGNVVFPGTGGPRLNVPFSISDPTFASRRTPAQNPGGRIPGRGTGNGAANWRRSTVIVAPVPVYVGASGPYVDGTGYETPYNAVQQQPNVTVIYNAPQPAPIVIQYGSNDSGSQQQTDTVSVYRAPVTGGSNPEGQRIDEPSTGYLFAFKDHTVYSAVAYWVDGDTLHYFTTANSHNQVSLSLVDRDLTERLNREKGSSVRLPQ